MAHHTQRWTVWVDVVKLWIEHFSTCYGISELNSFFETWTKARKSAWLVVVGHR